MHRETDGTTSLIVYATDNGIDAAGGTVAAALQPEDDIFGVVELPEFR